MDVYMFRCLMIFPISLQIPGNLSGCQLVVITLYHWFINDLQEDIPASVNGSQVCMASNGGNI